MKDFKSYKQSGAHGEERASEGTEKKPDFTEEDAAAATELARKALSGYNGRSDTAMLNEILRRAEADKRAGKLTDGQIDAFYAQFSPMLTPAQRKKLLSVVERLKKI